MFAPNVIRRHDNFKAGAIPDNICAVTALVIGGPFAQLGIES
jgi:hypothetical protein